MEPFRGQFTLPRLERVVAGPDTLQALGDELDRYGCSRALVVTGRTLGASPLLDRVQHALQHRCAGVFTGARQHVPSSVVDALVRTVQETAADALVSIGGGSPIDTAKGAVHRRLTAASGRDALPVHIAIPTTLSAGEFTDVAGITDETTRIKHAVADTRLAPRTVIADPVVTLDTPAWLWAASGIRALDHAVECLYSGRPHPISEPLAVRAIEMLLEHLPASLDGPASDRTAHRGACQMAAWLAVFGVTNAGFGLSHVVGHQIGPRWNVAHGVTSAIVLPHAMRFMAAAAPDRFAPIARGFGVPFDAAAPARSARACADRAAAFIARFGLAARLRDVDVPAGELRDIAELVAALMARSPVGTRGIAAAEVETVLVQAY